MGTKEAGAVLSVYRKLGPSTQQSIVEHAFHCLRVGRYRVSNKNDGVIIVFLSVVRGRKGSESNKLK